MHGVGEFVNLLATASAVALDQHLVENRSLIFDGNSFSSDETEPMLREVLFDFPQPNRLSLRAACQVQVARLRLRYLPWDRVGLSKAALGGAGSSFSSISQWNGCRLTFQTTMHPTDGHER